MSSIKLFWKHFLKERINLSNLKVNQNMNCFNCKNQENCFQLAVLGRKNLNWNQLMMSMPTMTTLRKLLEISWAKINKHSKILSHSYIFLMTGLRKLIQTLQDWVRKKSTKLNSNNLNKSKTPNNRPLQRLLQKFKVSWSRQMINKTTSTLAMLPIQNSLLRKRCKKIKRMMTWQKIWKLCTRSRWRKLRSRPKMEMIYLMMICYWI